MVCFYAVALIRKTLKIDDSLDVFAVHGVGGILGTLILPVLATLARSRRASAMSHRQQAWVQVQGVLAVVAWSVA